MRRWLISSVLLGGLVFVAFAPVYARTQSSHPQSSHSPSVNAKQQRQAQKAAQKASKNQAKAQKKQIKQQQKEAKKWNKSHPHTTTTT